MVGWSSANDRCATWHFNLGYYIFSSSSERFQQVGNFNKLKHPFAFQPPTKDQPNEGSHTYPVQLIRLLIESLTFRYGPLDSQLNWPNFDGLADELVGSSAGGGIAEIAESWFEQIRHDSDGGRLRRRKETSSSSRNEKANPRIGNNHFLCRINELTNSMVKLKYSQLEAENFLKSLSETINFQTKKGFESHLACKQFLRGRTTSTTPSSSSSWLLPWEDFRAASVGVMLDKERFVWGKLLTYSMKYYFIA